MRDFDPAYTRLQAHRLAVLGNVDGLHAAEFDGDTAIAAGAAAKGRMAAALYAKRCAFAGQDLDDARDFVGITRRNYARGTYGRLLIGPVRGSGKVGWGEGGRNDFWENLAKSIAL